MLGSITVAAREGNAGEVYHSASGRYALNALGMPNRGQAFYAEHLPAMATMTFRERKPLGVSVAGFSPAEYAQLTATAANGGADLIELNLGCPNIWQGSAQKRIASFDLPLCAQIIAEARLALDGTGRTVALGVKLSPFSDPTALAEIAGMLARAPIEFVCTCNTFPNAVALDAQARPQISVGLAGMSGPALLPVALGQLTQLRAALPEDLALIGAGGVSRGQDILAHRQAGARAVQVATAFWDRGEDPGVFSDLLADLF